METPIWYNPAFSLQIRREWKEKVMVVSDVIDYLTVPLSLEDLIQKFDIKMNFLEYAKMTSSLNTHLDWRGFAELIELRPGNSFLNILLSIDTRGVSNLYHLLYQKGNQRLDELTTK